MADDAQPFRIIVFGAELKRVVAPRKELSSRNYVLHFRAFDTDQRFDQYDGLIVFQGTFEVLEFTHNWMGETHLKHRVAKNELDRRIKELKLLFDKGGFACFILCEPFIDEDGGRDLSQTDLVKYFLKAPGVYRYNFASRLPQVRPMMSEFKTFLDVFGAANSWFQIDRSYSSRPIATAEGKVAGMILGRRIICVPSQIPDTPDGRTTPRAEEYFESLGSALVSVVRKQAVELPAWADAYQFEKERLTVTRKETLTQEMARVDSDLDSFRRFKWILISDGNDLVDAVKYVLETGFGFKVDAVDECREDVKLLDAEGNPFLFAEVKGTNQGVKREHVNQADSHRERANLPPTFPSILIMNTAIKNARSLDEKDQPVASEQVEHAKRHNILILRTLDLLRLLGLYSRGTITSGEVQRLLTTGNGWLRVTDGSAHLM